MQENAANMDESQMAFEGPSEINELDEIKKDVGNLYEEE